MPTARLTVCTLNDDFIANSTAKNGIAPLIENAARLPSQNHQPFCGCLAYPVKSTAPNIQDAATMPMITQSPGFLNISTLADASGTLLIAKVKTAVIKIVASRYSVSQPILTIPLANLCRSKYIFFSAIAYPFLIFQPRYFDSLNVSKYVSLAGPPTNSSTANQFFDSVIIPTVSFSTCRSSSQNNDCPHRNERRPSVKIFDFMKKLLKHCICPSQQQSVHDRAPSASPTV